MAIRVLILGESWRDHARMVPGHLEPLGAVHRDGRVHAFGRDQAGDYWIFGDGRPLLLPRPKMQRGIAAYTMQRSPNSGHLSDESDI